MSQVLARAEVHVSANYDEMMRGFTQIQQKTQQMTSGVTTSMERMSKQTTTSTRQASYGLLQLGYAVDDLQYGFRAIANNIPQIVMGLTGSMGIAGAAAIAATAINQLIQHWDQMFADESKLPRVKEGLEGLTESLKKVRSEIEPIQEAMDAISEGKQGMFGEWMDAVGIGPGALKNRLKLPVLKGMEADVKGRLRDEQALEGMGPEHTKGAQATGAAVKKAIAGLPQGAETLMDILMGRGMSQQDARKAIAGAARGNAGHLDDILGKLTPAERGGRFAGLAEATPQALKKAADQKEAVKKGQDAAAAQREADKLIDDQKKKEWNRLHHEAVEKKRDDDKVKAEEDRARKERGHVLARQGKAMDRVKDIWNKPFEAQNQQAQFMGVAEFAKFTQTGILNNPVQIQKEQLKRLEEIKEILKDNGMGMMNVRGVMVAGTPA